MPCILNVVILGWTITKLGEKSPIVSHNPIDMLAYEVGDTHVLDIYALFDHDPNTPKGWFTPWTMMSDHVRWPFFMVQFL